MRWILSIVLAALVAFPLLKEGQHPRELTAGTALRMNLEEVVDRSELVIEARVLGATPVLGENGDVFTDYELLVDRTYLGEPAGARTIRLPGGMLPTGRGTIVPGMACPHIGDELVLALTEEAEIGGARLVVGLSQGQYRLVRDGAGSRFAVREGAAAALVDAGGAPVMEPSSEVFDYADFVARLEAASNATRARRGEGEGR